MSELHPRLYWTADRSALVEEGDPRAASLAAGPSDPIPDLNEPGPETLVESTPSPEPAPVKRSTRKRA